MTTDGEQKEMDKCDRLIARHQILCSDLYVSTPCILTYGTVGTLMITHAVLPLFSEVIRSLMSKLDKFDLEQS